MQCHVWAAGNSLGPENSQINMFVDYLAAGTRANQLVTLQSIGFFDAPLSEDPIDVVRLPSTEDATIDLVTRAKAYFHVNCSNCHRPGGPGRGTADFRFEQAHSDMGVCNMPAQFDDFGNPQVALIVPGDPSLSAVNIRTSLLGVAAMPPLGKQSLDNAGIALLDDYVNSMTVCP
jgi:mono/diheme cytochrome c family protein